MKKAGCIFILLLISKLMFSQIYSFDFHAGYGTYQLKSIKNYQLFMRDVYSQFSPEAVERFPDYFNYMLTAGYEINNKNIIGINGGFYTTGGRNHVADYSGEYKLNMILKGYRLGCQYQYVYFSDNDISFYVQARAGSTFSVFKEKMFLDIYGISSSDYSSRFWGINFFGEPSIGIKYLLKTSLSLDINSGYQFDTNTKLHKQGEKNTVLGQLYNKDVKVNWSGLRLSLGVTYYLLK